MLLLARALALCASASFLLLWPLNGHLNLALSIALIKPYWRQYEKRSLSPFENLAVKILKSFLQSSLASLDFVNFFAELYQS